MHFCAMVAMLPSLLISLWAGSTTASLAAKTSQTLATSSNSPSYPPGDLKLYHFPGNKPGNIAFTPDGSAYSLVRSGLLRIAPDGTKTFVNVAGVDAEVIPGGRLAYSNGFLWYEVHQGLVRMHPDGTDARYFQVPTAFGQRDLDNFTAGADGIYYTYYNPTYDAAKNESLTGPVLASMSNAFVKTLYPLVAPVFVKYPNEYYGPTVGSVVYGPGGNVYFEYKRLPGKAVYFGRLTPSGNVTLFTDANRCGGSSKFVYSKGSFYFIGRTEASGQTPGTNVLCRVIASTGQYTTVLTRTASTLGNPSFDLTADGDGNLWISGFFGVGLYSYAVATGVVSGPVDPNVVNIINYYRYPILYTGTDQNIYFFGSYATNQVYFGAYVRHQMSFTPSAVGLLPSDTAMDFYVSEPIKGGPWSAVSLDPTIATVTPSGSIVGRFSVSQIGHGSTSIKVTDVYGNVAYLPVTAN